MYEEVSTGLNNNISRVMGAHYISETEPSVPERLSSFISLQYFQSHIGNKWLELDLPFFRGYVDFKNLPLKL